MVLCLDNPTDIYGIYDLDFGNDGALLENSLNNAQVQLNRTAATAKRLGHQLKEDRVQVQHQLYEKHDFQQRRH